MCNILSVSVRQTMEQGTVNWNDDRLDHFAEQVDKRFEQVDKRFDRFEERVDARFDHVEARIEAQGKHFDSRFDALQQSMIVTLAGILTAFAALVAATIF